MELTHATRKLKFFFPLLSALLTHARMVGLSSVVAAVVVVIELITAGWGWRMKWQLSVVMEEVMKLARLSLALTLSRTAQGSQLAQLSLWFPLVDDTKAGNGVKWNGVVGCWSCWNGEINRGWRRWSVWVENEMQSGRDENVCVLKLANEALVVAW